MAHHSQDLLEKKNEKSMAVKGYLDRPNNMETIAGLWWYRYRYTPTGSRYSEYWSTGVRVSILGVTPIISSTGAPTVTVGSLSL